MKRNYLFYKSKIKCLLQETKSKVKYPFFYLLKLARPEYLYIIVGVIICFVYGGFDVISASLNAYLAGVSRRTGAHKKPNPPANTFLDQPD